MNGYSTNLFERFLFSAFWVRLMFVCVFVYVVLQQENSANSLSSVHEKQSSLSLPPNVRHSPHNQDPVVSPPPPEDLWHLPGRLSEPFFWKIQFNVV